MFSNPIPLSIFDGESISGQEREKERRRRRRRDPKNRERERESHTSLPRSSKEREETRGER